MSSRREFLQNSFGGLSLLSMPIELSQQPFKKMKIVCVGGHPDDPESGCGGTLAKFAALGHDVTVIYFTRGEAGISGKSHDEAAGIRTQEAVAACKILKAKAIFAGEIDGESIVNNEWVTRVQQLIAAEKPDIVFTHWPIDSHKDHQAASILVIQTWMRSSEKLSFIFSRYARANKRWVFIPQTTLISPRPRNRNAKLCFVTSARIRIAFTVVAMRRWKISAAGRWV